MTKEDVIARAKESIAIEAKAIADIAGYMDQDAFYEAVKALATAPRITTCASGSSGIAAKKFAHSLCCIERGAQFLSPAEAVHGGMGCMKKGDSVVMVSRGGKTAELLPIIDVCMVNWRVVGSISADTAIDNGAVSCTCSCTMAVHSV